MTTEVPPEGRVIALFVAPAAEEAMIALDAVRAVEGQGLEGDRYYSGLGTFSNYAGLGRSVTLIETEAVAAARSALGFDVEAWATRRNIVTEDVALNDLVGFEFTVGAALLRGMRLCHPCKEMAKLAGLPGLLRALDRRGGLRADIVRGGVIRIGDTIRTVAPSRAGSRPPDGPRSPGVERPGAVATGEHRPTTEKRGTDHE